MRFYIYFNRIRGDFVKKFLFSKKLGFTLSLAALYGNFISAANYNTVFANDEFTKSEFFKFLLDYVRFCLSENCSLNKDKKFSKEDMKFSIFCDAEKEISCRSKIRSLRNDDSRFKVLLADLFKNSGNLSELNLLELVGFYIISGQKSADLNKGKEEQILNNFDLLQGEIFHFFGNKNSINPKISDFFKGRDFNDFFLGLDGKYQADKFGIFSDFFRKCNLDKDLKGLFGKNEKDMLSSSVKFDQTFGKIISIAHNRVQKKDKRFKFEKEKELKLENTYEESRISLLLDILGNASLLCKLKFLENEYIFTAMKEIIKSLEEELRARVCFVFLKKLTHFAKNECKYFPNIKYISYCLKFLVNSLSEKQIKGVFWNFVNNIKNDKDIGEYSNFVLPIIKNMVDPFNKWLCLSVLESTLPYLNEIFDGVSKEQKSILNSILKDLLLGKLQPKVKEELFFKFRCEDDSLAEKNRDNYFLYQEYIINSLEEYGHYLIVARKLLVDFYLLTKSTKKEDLQTKEYIFLVLQNIFSRLKYEDRQKLFIDILENKGNFLKIDKDDKKNSNAKYISKFFNLLFSECSWKGEKDTKIFEIFSEEQKIDLFKRILLEEKVLYKSNVFFNEEHLIDFCKTLVSNLNEKEKTDLCFSSLKGFVEYEKNLDFKQFLEILTKSLDVAAFSKDQKIDLFKNILFDKEILYKKDAPNNRNFIDFCKTLVSNLNEKEKTDLFVNTLDNFNSNNKSSIYEQIPQVLTEILNFDESMLFFAESNFFSNLADKDDFECFINIADGNIFTP